MDKYDPKKNIALMVDEWGTWWDVEPGTIPGHLFQQNTMRDAFVAALTLHVFHKYTDRVKIGQYRTDCQCIAIHDPHERQGHGAYAYLPCVRDVQGSSRRYLFADGLNLRQGVK